MVDDFAIEEPVTEETTETIVETVVDTGSGAGTSTPSEPVGTAADDRQAFAALVLGNPLISLDHNTGTGGNGAKAEQRSANSKAAKASSQFAADTMMAVAMTPAYRAAYNNPISLNIGGKDVEMSQGDLHKHFKTRETQLKKRIAKGQPANMSDAQWQALQDHYANVQGLVKDLDPAGGKAPADIGARASKALENDKVFAKYQADFMNVNDSVVDDFVNNKEADASLAAAGQDNQANEIKTSGRPSISAADQVNSPIISSAAPLMAAQFRQHADVKAVEVNNTADMSKEDVSVGIQKLDGANMVFA